MKEIDSTIISVVPVFLFSRIELVERLKLAFQNRGFSILKGSRVSFEFLVHPRLSWL